MNVLFSYFGGTPDAFYELLMYHPGTHKAAEFHVPGNVGALIESLSSYGAISVLYSASDLGPLTHKVEELTGVDIPFVVDMNAHQISCLVDVVGGVELFVPNPVDEVVAGRRVLFPSGSVILDGDKAVEYLRYESEHETAAERVDRRQKFLKALLVAMGENAELLLHQRSRPLLEDCLSTTLSARALRAFFAEMSQLETDQINFARVIGREQQVEGTLVLFPTEDGELVRIQVQQRSQAIARTEDVRQEDLVITVEVLNGTDINGLARRAANYLETFGIVVPATSVRNADNDEYLSTVVLDRKGRPDVAQRVAEIIRCDRTYSRVGDDVDPTIDVTIILGQDFDGKHVQD